MTARAIGESGKAITVSITMASDRMLVFIRAELGKNRGGLSRKTRPAVRTPALLAKISQAGLPASLQAKRMLSIKRVLPKKTASNSTLFGPAISTGFNVSASTTSM
jgi:hypothetical protein